MQDTQHERLAFMAQSGIDMQVLSYGNSSPQNLSPEQAVPFSQLANDELAKAVAAHPDRYAGLAVLPVGDPQAAVAELNER